MPLSIILIGGVLILAGILVLVVYGRQQHEKRKLEQLRRIRNLADRGQQIAQLIDSIPSQYLSQDLRVFMLEQWRNSLHEQEELGCKESRIKTEMEALQAKLNDVRGGKQTGGKVATDINGANLVRRGLKQLHKVILELYKDKKIAHRIAQIYINEIKLGFTYTLIEVFKASARQAEVDQNWRVAVVHYKRIMSELNKSNPNGVHNQTLLECRQNIAALEQKVLEAEANGDTSALASSVDTLISEEDSWKKKQLYDD